MCVVREKIARHTVVMESSLGFGTKEFVSDRARIWVYGKPQEVYLLWIVGGGSNVSIVVCWSAVGNTEGASQRKDRRDGRRDVGSWPSEEIHATSH